MLALLNKQTHDFGGMLPVGSTIWPTSSRKSRERLGVKLTQSKERGEFAKKEREGGVLAPLRAEIFNRPARPRPRPHRQDGYTPGQVLMRPVEARYAVRTRTANYTHAKIFFPSIDGNLLPLSTTSFHLSCLVVFSERG